MLAEPLLDGTGAAAELLAGLVLVMGCLPPAAPALSGAVPRGDLTAVELCGTC